MASDDHKSAAGCCGCLILLIALGCGGWTGFGIALFVLFLIGAFSGNKEEIDVDADDEVVDTETPPPPRRPAPSPRRVPPPRPMPIREIPIKIIPEKKAEKPAEKVERKLPPLPRPAAKPVGFECPICGHNNPVQSEHCAACGETMKW